MSRNKHGAARLSSLVLALRNAFHAVGSVKEIMLLSTSTGLLSKGITVDSLTGARCDLGRVSLCFKERERNGREEEKGMFNS